MNRGLLAALATLLAGAGLALADDDPLPAGVPVGSCASCGAAADHELAGGDCGARGETFWVTAEYLLWWIKDSPLPVPLVSTGVIGEPGTAVSLGGRPL